MTSLYMVWNVPGKNLVVFITSLTFFPKNPPVVEAAQNPKPIRAKNLLKVGLFWLSSWLPQKPSSSWEWLSPFQK
jgi:hypothetical protein